MIVEIAGIPVKITKKRIKKLHLYVKPPDGRVEVTAPFLMSDEFIFRFVRSKAGWIRSKQVLVRSNAGPAEMQFVSGEPFYLWENEYRLRVEYGNRYSLVLDGNDAVLTVRKGSTAEQRRAWVNEWYREKLREEIERLLPAWVGRTGLEPSSWQIKNMKTRWGTCNTKTRKIWLSLQLAKKPLICLEYVILHELAHLRVRDHGKNFAAIMDRYMPDWREVRTLLNGTGQ